MPDFLTDSDLFFQFKLTRDLGYRSVREMRETLTAGEYRDWIGFYRAEIYFMEQAQREAKNRH